jgi:hypothetical protein
MPFQFLKNYFPFLLVLALFSGFACNKKKKVLPDLHEKRPESPAVKTKQHYIADSTGVEMLYEVEEFDKSGHRVHYIRYQKKDTIDFEETYTPDEKGNPIKTIKKYLDGSTETATHTYDKDGKALRTEWVRSDGTKGRHEYKYDDKDSLVQWERYQDGKYLITQLWPNVYDENGWPIESWYKETNNGKDTSTPAHWQYRYDSAGRLTHRLTLSGAALQTAEQYYYDSLNNPIMIVEYGADTARPGSYIPQKRTANTFNEYGELLRSSVLDGNGRELERVENGYDKYGHLIQSVVTTVTDDGKAIVQKQRWEYSYY